MSVQTTHPIQSRETSRTTWTLVAIASGFVGLALGLVIASRIAADGPRGPDVHVSGVATVQGAVPGSRTEPLANPDREAIEARAGNAGTADQGPRVAEDIERSADPFARSDAIPSVADLLRSPRINPKGLDLSPDHRRALQNIANRVNAQHFELRAELHRAMRAHARSMIEAGLAVPVTPGAMNWEHDGRSGTNMTVGGQTYSVRYRLADVPELYDLDAESRRVLEAGLEELAQFVAAHGRKR